MTVLTVLGLGFVLGIRHAFDADHLVAVSTVVTNTNSRWRALWIGIYWGVGHTCTLLLVGVFVLILNIQIPASVESLLEGVVGVMLLWLGFGTLHEWWRKNVHAHSHAHASEVHAHFHMHLEGEAHAHDHVEIGGSKPLLLGMIHGLAGSAALMVLVLASVSSPVLGVGYMLLFGGGSVLGMGLISLLFSMSFSLAKGRAGGLSQVVRLAVAMLSIMLGTWMIVEVGFS